MNPSRGTGRLFSLIVVTGLAAASVLPAPYATLWPDTVRDLSASLALARGEAFPLVGPAINLGPNLGPAFLWLQAAVLLFFPSIAAASVFVAAIASLKFYFLYFLGRVLSGDRLGLCLAVGAAFPSIAAFQWIVFFHPNWVEAGIAAALLLLALALKRRSIGFVYAASATLGLAIQFHPTALYYYPFVACTLVALAVRNWRLAAHLGGTLLTLLVWFAPVLFAGTAQQGGLEGVSARMEAGLRAFVPADALTVMRTAFIDVPMAIGETYAAEAGVPRRVWRALLVISGLVCIGGAVAKALEPGRWRWTLAALLALMLAGWMAVTAVRTYTPFYLCYFLLPLSMLLLGVGLERAAASQGRMPRLLGYGAIAAIVFCFASAAVGARTLGMGARIESRLPLLADLKHPEKGKTQATLVTAAARDALVRHLCDQPGGVTLHGDLAYVMAASTGLDFRFHCPAHVAGVRILGPAEGRMALTALPDSQARRIGIVPQVSFVGLAALPVRQSIHPHAGRPIERQWYYFERLIDRQPLVRVALDFSTGPGEAVMVLRLKPFASVWQNFRVVRDAHAASPALSTYNSDVYLSGAAPRTAWRVEFDTDAPQWVDVHVF